MNYDSATSLFNEIAIAMKHPCAVHFLPDGNYRVYADFSMWPLNSPEMSAAVKAMVEQRGFKWHINSLGVMEIS